MDKTTDRDKKMGFAHRLRVAREARGFKVQAEFARLIGVPVQTYGGWETGVAMPQSITPFEKVCDTLGVTSDWLLFGRSHGLQDGQFATLAGGEPAARRKSAIRAS